ncbi:hypothetical protein [Roseovarius sp. TE539]|uniref:hypothetical protein n=1 Tax=Roseovarius sp. TE539 TaxID=2249812 RepID=UPI0011BF4404|nr:hypothetical protein [Roseovarius sp. TE539]
MKSEATRDQIQKRSASKNRSCDGASREDNAAPSRSAAETREIARALAQYPIPEFTKKNISRRWSVGADTVRRVLRDFGLNPGKTRDLTVPLTDLLAVEGVSDPLKAWALCSDDERLVLLADLLTPESKREDDNRLSKLHLGTYRRHAREGRLVSIRIGKQHRFRRDLASALYCHEMLLSKQK